MKKINKKMIRSILEHRGQYAALLLLISIGITIYLSFVMAVNNLSDTVEQYYQDYGLADFYVTPSDSAKALSKLNQLEYDMKVETRGIYKGNLVFDNDEAKVGILSLTKQVNTLFNETANDKLASTYELSEDEVFIIKPFANARNIEAGDRIRLKFAGEYYELKVAGVVLSPEFTYLVSEDTPLLPMPAEYGIIYVNQAFLKKTVGEDFVNQILVKNNLLEEEQLKEMGNEIKDIDEVLYIISKEETISYTGTQEEIEGEKAMAESLPVVFLFIAAIIMAVLMARKVESERTEIGVLKALGYSNTQILWTYIQTTTFIGTTGAIIGMIFGGIVSYQFTRLYTTIFSVPLLAYHFEGKYLLQALVLSVLFSSIAGVFGARKILRLMPQESMRPMPPKKGKRIAIEGLRLYKRMKFTNKMVVRNIFRQKGRVLLTLLGVAVSFAMLLTPYTFYNLMNSMFVKQYKEIKVIDHDIKLKSLYSEEEIEGLVKDLNANTDGYTEEYLEFPIELQYKDETKTSNIIGLKEVTKVYNLEDVNKVSVKVKPGELYLSEGLATVLKINKGDVLQIKNYFNDKTVRVMVTGIVEQKVGSNIYTTIDWLREQLFEDYKLVNGVYVQGDIDKGAIEKNDIVLGVSSVADIINVYKKFMALIIVSLGMLVVFSGIIAFIVIYVISVMAINDRRGEFASLRVMGIRKNEIFGIVLKENIVASIFGILVGIPMGRIMMDYFSTAFTNELYSLSMDIGLDSILFAMAFTLIFVFLGQLITKRKINRINFIEALKQRST